MRTLPGTVLAAAFAALLPGAPAARGAGDQDFDSIRKEFPSRVSAEDDPEARALLVGRLAQFGTEDAGRLLMAGLVFLDVRCEGQLREYERLLAELEPLKGVLDVMKDNYKTRTELQRRVMAEESRQRAEAPVFRAFRDALAGLKDAKAVAAAAAQAKREKSWRVRALAGEGIARNPGATALEASLRALKDPDGRVRGAVLGALAGRKEPEVVDAAIAGLKDAAWPVRKAAADALGASESPRAVRPLIEALGAEEGRLRDDFRDTLRKMTGQNFDSEPEPWKAWYLENREDFEGPSPKAALFGAFKSKDAGRKKGVYGIESRSRRIVFVIDTSGSMKDPLAGAKPVEGTPTGLTPEEEEELHATKIDIAKRELRRAIKALEPDALFDIVSFDSSVIRWKPGMVKADQATKNEATTFVRGLEASGGTWTYGALHEAFQVAGIGVTDKNYDPSVDTIYLISDGAPTDDSMEKPTYMEPKIILDAVREWNPLGKVVIHAVAIDVKAAGGRFIDFMKRLAAENGGQYTQRG